MKNIIIGVLILAAVITVEACIPFAAGCCGAALVLSYV